MSTPKFQTHPSTTYSTMPYAKLVSAKKAMATVAATEVILLFLSLVVRVIYCAARVRGNYSNASFRTFLVMTPSRAAVAF